MRQASCAGLRVSIILPVLDEAAGIGAALDALQPLRARGHEVIVVDGGSSDATVAIARPLADRVIGAARGRALQMNAGAAAASGAALLFLHADTQLPENADVLIAAGLRRRNWGRFDVRIASDRRMLAVVGCLMNLRSRLTGIATGDQAIFASREAFEQAGRFPAIALMEDVALCARLKRGGRPACLAQKVVTSGRRWEQRGVWRTIFLMWRLRLQYLAGAAPAKLADLYDARSRRS